MIRSFLNPLLPLSFCLAQVCADEVTIESKPFAVERSFSATALPSAPVLLKLDPEAWATFKFTALAPHGAKVEAGTVLAAFEADDFQEKLDDTRRAVAAGALSLAQAELDYNSMVETAGHQLEAVRTAARIAREENQYFIKTRRKSAEETAAQSLESARQYLANQKEELNQLEKMYAADDLTEETEEIILERQKDAVTRAEFALKMEEFDHERTLKVLLPREAVDLANKDRDSALALAKFEAEQPGKIKLKEAELIAARVAQKRAVKSLTDLEADQGLFEVKAPAAGWFYYGAMEDGRWTTGEALKSLMVHGVAPLNKAYATFIPANAPLSVVAFLDEAAARSLAVGAEGSASIPGREDLLVPVKLTALAATPGPDAQYRATLSAEWPEGVVAVPGSGCEVTLLAYENPKAIVVANAALAAGAKGWTVEVKLADGKTERRVVKRGRAGKDVTEIVSGIEPGQVILVP
jgi:multidrug efflux pump subunit AcrA (membrane-fusion protein)